MNKYTLKFENQALEDKYLLYSNKQQILHIRNFLKISYPIMTLQGIACVAEGSYIAALSSIGFIVLITILLIAQLSELNTIRLYESSMLMNPFIGFAIFYFSNSQALTINLMVLLLVETQIFVLTPHVFLALIHFINNFLANLTIMYFTFGFTLHMLTWIPVFFFCIYHYYTQKRMQRLLFQGSQVNQSIYNLIKETTADDVIYFKFNHEQLKYELEFTNIQELDLSMYLSSMQVDSQQNLKQFLFSKTQTNIYSLKQQVIVYDKNKQKNNLDIYIQSYPELRFYLRIIKQQKMANTFTENESKLLYKFYERMRLKCQQKCKQIRVQSIVKQLCSLNAKVQFQRIISNPSSFLKNPRQLNILELLQRQLQNLSIRCDIQSDLLESPIIISSQQIIQTMIYKILSIISIKNDQVSVFIHRDIYLITITFTFEHSILYYNQFKIKAEKLRLLQEMLSYKQIIFNDHQCHCFIDEQKDIAYA